VPQPEAPRSDPATPPEPPGEQPVIRRRPQPRTEIPPYRRIRPRLDRPVGGDPVPRPRPRPSAADRPPASRPPSPRPTSSRPPSTRPGARSAESWLDEVPTPRRPVRRTESEPVDPDRRTARRERPRPDDWTASRRTSGESAPRRSQRPASAQRQPPPGGVTLPTRTALPFPTFRGAHTRRLRLLGPLLVLVAIAIGIAALVGAFSSGRHVQLPTLPAIPARAIETQNGPPATVSLNTTFGGARAPSGKLSTLELDLARGFHFDPLAAATCPATQAKSGTCPADSAIGSGTGEIVVQGPYLPRTTYDVSTAVYLTAPTHRDDIAGVALDLTEAQSQLHAVIFGRVVPLPTSSYSIALRFADASQALSTNYDLNLRRLALTLQASRTVSSHAYHLLTNPTPCTHRGWPLQLSITSAKNAWIYHGDASCRSSTEAQS
jgi:hypothetical protein